MADEINLVAPVTLDLRGATAQWQKFESSVARSSVGNSSLGTNFKGLAAGVKDFDRALGSATNRVIAFGSASAVFYNIIKAFDTFVKSTIDVENHLARINLSLGQTASQTKDFTSNLFNAARETGQSFDTAAKAAETLARQGLSATEVIKRLREALLLARVSGTDTATAVSDITTTLNSFSKEALSAADVVNRFVAISTKFGTSSKDIGDAVERAGEVASEAGVPLNKFIALISSVQQITQRSGADISTAFKTIFTRTQEPQILDDLQRLGVAIKDTKGNVLPAIQILQSLAKVFGSLSEAQQSNVTILLAGARQGNILKTTLSDLSSEYSKYDQALKIANGASNDAERANAKLNDTLKSRIDSTKNSVTQLFASIGNQGFGSLSKEILTEIDSVRKFLSGETGSELGKSLGDGIIKGISNVLTGPAILGVGKILIAGFSKVIQTIGTDLASLVGINRESTQRIEIQRRINGLLEQATKEELAQYRAAQTVLQAKEAILAINLRIAQTDLVGTPVQNAFLGKNSLGLSKITLPRIPTLADPLQAAINREIAAGAPKGQIYVGSDARVAGPDNPNGVVVANRRDEPYGAYQGVDRVLAEGGDPKTAGMISNFARPLMGFRKGAIQIGTRGAFGRALANPRRSDLVFKEYHNETPDSELVSEYNISKELEQRGLPVAKVYGSLDRSVKRGGLFKERIHGFIGNRLDDIGLNKNDIQNVLTERFKKKGVIADDLSGNNFIVKGAIKDYYNLKQTEGYDRAREEVLKNTVVVDPGKFRIGERPNFARSIPNMARSPSGRNVPNFAAAFTGQRARVPNMADTFGSKDLRDPQGHFQSPDIFNALFENLRKAEPLTEEFNKFGVAIQDLAGTLHKISQDKVATKVAEEFNNATVELQKRDFRKRLKTNGEGDIYGTGSTGFPDIPDGPRGSPDPKSFAKSKFELSAKDLQYIHEGGLIDQANARAREEHETSSRQSRLDARQPSIIAQNKRLDRLRPQLEQARRDKLGISDLPSGYDSPIGPSFEAFQQDRQQTRASRSARFKHRINQGVFAATFVAPFAAGFIPEGPGGTAKGVGLGAASGALQGVGFGGLFGPIGAAVGGGLGALTGAFLKATKSADELSKEIDDNRSKRAQESNALDRALQIQEKLNEARQEGAPSDVVGRLSEQYRSALLDVGSSGRSILSESDPRKRAEAVDKFQKTEISTQALEELQKAVRPTGLRGTGQALETTGSALGINGGGLRGLGFLFQKLAPTNESSTPEETDHLGKTLSRLITSQNTGNLDTGRLKSIAGGKSVSDDDVTFLNKQLVALGYTAHVGAENVIKLSKALVGANQQYEDAAKGVADQTKNAHPVGLANSSFLDSGNLDVYSSASEVARNPRSNRFQRAQSQFNFFQEQIKSGQTKEEDLIGQPEYEQSKGLVQTNNVAQRAISFLTSKGSGRYRAQFEGPNGPNLSALTGSLTQVSQSGVGSSSEAQRILKDLGLAQQTNENSGASNVNLRNVYNDPESQLTPGVKYQTYAGGTVNEQKRVYTTTRQAQAQAESRDEATRYIKPSFLGRDDYSVKDLVNGAFDKSLKGDKKTIPEENKIDLNVKVAVTGISGADFQAGLSDAIQNFVESHLQQTQRQINVLAANAKGKPLPPSNLKGPIQ